MQFQKKKDYSSAPRHVCDELIKLNGCNFRRKKIIVEEATSTRKKVELVIDKSDKRRPQVVVNNFPENQDLFQRPKIVPGNKSYSEAVKSTRKIIVFGDSIPRGIKMNEFNRHVQRGFAKMKSFPGATSKEMLHYIEPTLKEGSFDTAIIHVGINDILKDKSENEMNELYQNLKKIGVKCHSYGVKEVHISGIVINNKMAESYVNFVNGKISDLCQENSFYFIDNSNISKFCLFKDGLHLLEEGKCFLANNFIYRLNFLATHHHHPHPNIQNMQH